MKIRDANISDAKAIHALVTYYAEFDRMLFRSMADIYENLQTFKVVEEQGRVVGCCAVQVIWSDLAELKSLAVDKEFAGRVRPLACAGRHRKSKINGCSENLRPHPRTGIFQKARLQADRQRPAAHESLAQLREMFQTGKLRRNCSYPRFEHISVSPLIDRTDQNIPGQFPAHVLPLVPRRRVSF